MGHVKSIGRRKKITLSGPDYERERGFSDKKKEEKAPRTNYVEAGTARETDKPGSAES